MQPYFYLQTFAVTKNHSHNAQVFKLPNALSWQKHGFISMKKHKLALWFYIGVIFFDKLRPRPNGRYFREYIVKSIFLNDNVYIFIKISLKFVLKGPFNNIPALVQIMAWRRPGDRVQSEPMMGRLQTPICVTKPQWVKSHIQIGDISISKHQLHDIAKYVSCKAQQFDTTCYVIWVSQSYGEVAYSLWLVACWIVLTIVNDIFTFWIVSWIWLDASRCN